MSNKWGPKPTFKGTPVKHAIIEYLNRRHGQERESRLLIDGHEVHLPPHANVRADVGDTAHGVVKISIHAERIDVYPAGMRVTPKRKRKRSRKPADATSEVQVQEPQEEPEEAPADDS